MLAAVWQADSANLCRGGEPFEVFTRERHAAHRLHEPQCSPSPLFHEGDTPAQCTFINMLHSPIHVIRDGPTAFAQCVADTCHTGWPNRVCAVHSSFYSQTDPTPTAATVCSLHRQKQLQPGRLSFAPKGAASAVKPHRAPFSSTACPAHVLCYLLCEIQS